MKNRWNEPETAAIASDPKKLRVYTSQLLGREPELVLHGGGNTSLKVAQTDFFGDETETLFVKGSGWDLSVIEEEGFASLRMDVLRSLARLQSLSDTDMVQQQRQAMLDPAAPDASVEAILHAIIPFRYVDHTHADSLLAIMNTLDGENRIRECFGDRVLVVPYVMPGFALARRVFEITQGIDWHQYEGMVLMNHGVFTFGDQARDSYERMIRLASEAEAYLAKEETSAHVSEPEPASSEMLARIRRDVSLMTGHPVVAAFDTSEQAVGFSSLPDIESIASRGPLTPDHSILAKRIPVIFGDDPLESLATYSDEYKAYFKRHAHPGLSPLDPAPRWAVWPKKGILSFGQDRRAAQAIQDIARHTAKTIQLSEGLGGWQPLPESEVFQVEYWELEQAKLKRSPAPLPLTGKIALIQLSDPAKTRQCQQALEKQGAIALAFADSGPRTSLVEEAVLSSGGIDFLITEAPHGLLAPENHSVFQAAIRFLQTGIDPAVVAIASLASEASGPSLRDLCLELAQSTQSRVRIWAVDRDAGNAYCVPSADDSLEDPCQRILSLLR